LTIAIDAAPFVSNSKKNLEDYYNLLKNKVDSNKVRCLENTKRVFKKVCHTKL